MDNKKRGAALWVVGMSKYLKYVKRDYIEPDILFVGLWLDGVMWYVGWMLVHAQMDWLRVVGWLFFGMKGITLIVTFAGLLAHPVKGWDLLTGRYRFDTRPMRGLVQALTRFTWELPQLEVGYWVAQGLNVLGKVERVDILDGVVFATGRSRKAHNYVGMSIGCFVNMWIPDRVGCDFEKYARHSPFNIYRHEYGHTVDSQRWGWLYLPVVGLGSLVSQALGLNPRVRHRHEDFWAERRADRLGERYFGKDEWPD